ncbi:hypothetical protein V8E51_020014 [Hyaloscypha variabilis]
MDLQNSRQPVGIDKFIFAKQEGDEWWYWNCNTAELDRLAHELPRRAKSSKSTRPWTHAIAIRRLIDCIGRFFYVVKFDCTREDIELLLPKEFLLQVFPDRLEPPSPSINKSQPITPPPTEDSEPNESSLSAQDGTQKDKRKGGKVARAGRGKQPSRKSSAMKKHRKGSKVTATPYKTLWECTGRDAMSLNKVVSNIRDFIFTKGGDHLYDHFKSHAMFADGADDENAYNKYFDHQTVLLLFAQVATIFDFKYMMENQPSSPAVEWLRLIFITVCCIQGQLHIFHKEWATDMGKAYDFVQKQLHKLGNSEHPSDILDAAEMQKLIRGLEEERNLLNFKKQEFIEKNVKPCQVEAAIQRKWKAKYQEKNGHQPPQRVNGFTVSAVFGRPNRPRRSLNAQIDSYVADLLDRDAAEYNGMGEDDIEGYLDEGYALAMNTEVKDEA